MSAITLLFLFVPVLVAILLMVNVLLAAHRPDTEKVTAYECGFSPIYGQTRAPFSIQYYLVGILFLIFDLEVLLMYPLAVTLYNVSVYGFWIAIIFFTVLTLGFVYELGRGALYFTDQRSAVRVTSLDNSKSPSSNGYKTSNTPNKRLSIRGLHTIASETVEINKDNIPVINKNNKLPLTFLVSFQLLCVVAIVYYQVSFLENYAGLTVNLLSLRLTRVVCLSSFVYLKDPVRLFFGRIPVFVYRLMFSVRIRIGQVRHFKEIPEFPNSLHNIVCFAEGAVGVEQLLVLILALTMCILPSDMMNKFMPIFYNSTKAFVSGLGKAFYNKEPYALKRRLIEMIIIFTDVILAEFQTTVSAVVLTLIPYSILNTVYSNHLEEAISMFL